MLKLQSVTAQGQSVSQNGLDYALDYLPWISAAKTNTLLEHTSWQWLSVFSNAKKNLNLPNSDKKSIFEQTFLKTFS